MLSSQVILETPAGYWFLKKNIFSYNKTQIFQSNKILYPNAGLIQLALGTKLSNGVFAPTSWFFSNLNLIKNIGISYIVKINNDTKKEYDVYKKIKEYERYNYSMEKSKFLEVLDQCSISPNCTVLIFDEIKSNLTNFYKEYQSKNLLDKIFIELIQAFKLLHELGLTHGDVKPDNILIDNNLNTFLIDFDITIPFIINGKFKINRKYKSYGTPLFAAIPALTGISNAPINDIESLLYTLCYLLKLPPFDIINSKDTKEVILDHKEDFSDKILNDKIEHPFKKVFQYCYSFPYETSYNLCYDTITELYKTN
ncbi:serine/threonine protein kinase [Carp edema virus]|nr:serine/threonine protein kinase [Carp edema virus]